MFLFRKQYPLPKFPPQVRPLFRELCEDFSADRIEQLRELVRKNHHETRHDREHELGYDSVLADKIAAVCEFLLDLHPTLPRPKQRLIVGGVRYFAEANDPLPEKTFACGFDDDVRVINHVLEAVGVTDKFIKLPR